MKFEKREKNIYQVIIECNLKLKRALEDKQYTASSMKEVHRQLNELEEDFIYMNDSEEILFIQAKVKMSEFLNRKD